MNNKGFTLIELLSVVILLSILIFLVLPNITNMIKSYSNETNEVVLKMIKDAAKLYREDNKNTIKQQNYCVSIDELVNNDYLKDNIKYKGSIINDTMSVLITYEGIYNYDLVKNKYCNKIENGTPIYFDVERGEGCTRSEYEKSYSQEKNDYLNSSTGYNGIDNKVKGQNSCLKFYAFNDDEGITLNLLLDHNTTATIAWNSSYNNVIGPKEVIEQLKIDTGAWKGTLLPSNYTVNQGEGYANYEIDYNNYKARLITANEIATITGNEKFDVATTNYNEYFYFDTNTSTQSITCKSGDISGCDYGWLNDRTATDCTTYGCLNNANTETYGYWTGTSVAGVTYHAWNVGFSGVLYYFVVDHNDSRGIRPVIEVLKSNLN